MTNIQENSSTCPDVNRNLMTRWGRAVDPCSVLPEYPRPQMKRRAWMNLNGLWEYAIDSIEGESISDYHGQILVPFPVESALSGVRKPLLPGEILRYRRSFTLPEEWSGQRILLHFGAVDWHAEVRINGHIAGSHTGGCCPFTVEITPYLLNNNNELVVLVKDDTDTTGQQRGKQSLHPKGLFYTAVSGIWQTVWLEPVPDHYIQSLRITPDLDRSALLVSIETGGSCRGLAFEAKVYDGTAAAASGQSPAEGTLLLSWPNVKTWSPDSPFLYDLEIRLIRDGETVDEICSYAGMRKFSVEPDARGIPRLCLNGSPLFQHGILDQGYWPDGLYTAPTDDALLYDVLAAKRLGFNMIRKHIKVEPARWYYHCDRHGMIVWQDMMNGGGGWNHLHHLILPNLAGNIRIDDTRSSVQRALGREHAGNRRQFEEELKEMVDTLYNVTSIGVWVPFNEAWGQFDAAKTADWLKSYDPTRLVDHASGWHDQQAGDIKSLHVYFRKLRMPKQTAGRTAAISEYGGYSHPVKGHLWHEGRSFGYRSYKSRNKLGTAYVSLIREQLKPLIAEGISAAVYTQLTDVETETNGLLTYDREVFKLDPEELRSLHAELYAALQE